MATYRLLADHFVGQQYLEAGAVVSDGPDGVLPSGWIPTLACDPLDVDGTNKRWAAGPTEAMGSAEHGALSLMNGNRWVGKPVAAPNVYWEAVTVNMPRLGAVHGFQLHGAENLGFKSSLGGPPIQAVGVGGGGFAVALVEPRLDGVSSIAKVRQVLTEPAPPQVRPPIEGECKCRRQGSGKLVCDAIRHKKVVGAWMNTDELGRCYVETDEGSI